MPKLVAIMTRGRGMLDITREIAAVIDEAGVKEGVAHLFIQHTSASLVVQENADPDVLEDLGDYFDRIAPEEFPYRHYAEGPDDMPAHIKSALTATSLSIPVMEGKLALGAWQGIYLFEHRHAPHERKIAVSVIREG